MVFILVWSCQTLIRTSWNQEWRQVSTLLQRKRTTAGSQVRELIQSSEGKFTSWQFLKFDSFCSAGCRRRAASLITEVTKHKANVCLNLAEPKPTRTWSHNKGLGTDHPTVFAQCSDAPSSQGVNVWFWVFYCKNASQINSLKFISH